MGLLSNAPKPAPQHESVGDLLNVVESFNAGRISYPQAIALLAWAYRVDGIEMRQILGFDAGESADTTSPHPID